MTATLGLHDRPRRRDGLLAQRAADTRVLLDPRDGRYYALDGVAGSIWDLCDGSRSVADIVEEIAREYDAPTEEVAVDALAFLAELLDGDLVALEASAS